MYSIIMLNKESCFHIFQLPISKNRSWHDSVIDFNKNWLKNFYSLKFGLISWNVNLL